MAERIFETIFYQPVQTFVYSRFTQGRFGFTQPERGLENAERRML